MRPLKLSEIASMLAIVVALLAIFLTYYEFPPGIDRELHASIGRTLAKETLNILGEGGQITVISRDTEAFKQPAIDILLDSFQKELRRANASAPSIQLMSTDPLRPVDVPAGDFYEILRRSTTNHVIVSLMGPPLLTDEQRNKLGAIKPKILAFCSGGVASRIDLSLLFNAKLLHAAVVCNTDPSGISSKKVSGEAAFNQLYRIMRATDGLPPSGVTKPMFQKAAP